MKKKAFEFTNCPCYLDLEYLTNSPNKLTNLSEGRKMSDSDSSFETWYFVKKSVKIKMYIV